jgi:hypothetical protein
LKERIEIIQKSNVLERLEVQNFERNFKGEIQKIGPKVAFDIEEI